MRKKIRIDGGISRSANGKYVYWSCTLTGIKTFATVERFQQILAKYGGSEEKLAQTFVLPTVTRYLNDGFSIEDIRQIIANNNGKLPPLGGRKKKIAKVKKPRRKRLRSFAVGKTEVEVQTDTGSVEMVEKPVYPWSNNPDYFKSPPAAISIERITETACLFPARYIDDQCRECPIYGRCVLPQKFTEEDWKKPHKSREIKIIPLKSFESVDI